MAQYSQVRHVMRDGHLPSKRPRLLFLAYPFPPATPIACVRTWNVAKYLQRLRWDVTVVTLHPSMWRRVENPEAVDAEIEKEGIQRIFTDHRWRWLAPNALNTPNEGLTWFAAGLCREITQRVGIDPHIGWVQAAELACSVLRPGDVDIILATGAPFAAFILAKRLSTRIGCPYVLDYRDPWTGSPHGARPVRSVIIRQEAKLLRNCAAVMMVSPSWAAELDQRFGVGSKLHVVTNAYDPEGLAGVRPYNFGHFAIVYAGQFYPPKRVISPIMAALRGLKDTGDVGAWFFHYYGGQEDHVRAQAKEFGLTERLILHGRVPRAEALAAARGAGMNVVITSVTEDDTPRERGIIPGKLFELLGLRAPVLVIAPPHGDIQAIIQVSGLGYSFPGNDIAGISLFLKNAMQGRTYAARDLQAYAWPNLAMRIDTILYEVVQNTTRDKAGSTVPHLRSRDY